ncbi:hypothetical protein CKAH01_06180 [Colletotrichum kahawae]|uniref:Uncharacterized protein n=1 Tax=Colletotrichum kahawae TaxID=34407 RepID=A0AAE0D3A8_COLKA|nr:hypothetical protein CKAH01_06180 [Colletotrichum kahawae]
MSALPPNWEWDYDGTRWFYRYKPNGHVQFHFPKEGDEFPDFFDAMSPIPDLSPEEKLESQQQMKRRTGGDPDPKSKMRATGGPLADFGMSRSGFGGPLDDDDGAGFFYQPENLMYLGPGAYNDVSPLADEDERDEIPRDRRKSRDSASPKKDRTTLELAGSDKTGVSPLQSETNTPSVKNSVPVRESAAVPESVAEEAVLIINTQELPGPSQPAIPSPGVPLLDSVEKPRPTAARAIQSPPWDPVGVVAEMATEHTAPAHIEIHPDPVEMGDNAVLAPIETRIMDPGIAELPERTSPSDAKPLASSTHDLLHQTSMSDHALYGATFGTGSRPQNSSPTNSGQASTTTRPQNSSPTNSGQASTTTRPLAVPPKIPLDDSLPEVVPDQTQSSTSTSTAQPFSIKRKPSKTGAKQGTYKPYVPGSTPNPIPDKPQSKEPEFVRRDHRNSLAREASLMLGPRQSYETSNMPSILQPPQIPPKQPLESTLTLIQHPVNPARPDATRTQTEPAGVLTGVTHSSGPSKGPLQYVPSVIKPARGRPQEAATTLPPPSSANQVLSGSTQFSAFRPGVQPKAPGPGQIPHSLTPSQAPQPLSGPRPCVQRVETAPVQAPLNHRMARDHASMVEPGTRPSAVPTLPAFLQRPTGQGDSGGQPASRSQPHPSSFNARARSRSDLPQPLHNTHGTPAFTIGQVQPPPRPGSAAIPRAESPPKTSIATRPQSAMDFMQGRSDPRIDRVINQTTPTPPPERPRQTSHASSEVSSLGPPSGSQSSGVPFQTPSPLESNGRRPSSGFFRSADANAYPVEFAATPVPLRQNPFEIQTGPLRSPASRPASFSGPSPTSTQPTTPGSAGFDITAGPPEISSVVSAKPLPAQATPNGSSKYDPQQQPYQQGQEIPRPHSAQPVPSDSGVGNQPGARPPYPLEDGQNMPRPADRPQRPTVTPPSQQFLGPASPRTPGHILHPIQEHHDSGATNQNVSVIPAFQNTDSAPRASPASVRQLPAGSSHYPSSAESPGGQGNMMGRGNITSMPQAMSPAVATMGETYSPVQSNPFQVSPTTTKMQPPTQVVRPGSTPQVMPQSAKDKEKGGWRSKIMKGSGKPNVLQKPPSSPNTGPPSPHSPNTARPAKGGQWAGSSAQGHNSGRVAAQQSNQATYIQPAPAAFQQTQPITSEPVSRPQNSVPAPAGPILAPPTDRQEPVISMQQAPAVEAPQVAPRLHVRSADAIQSMEKILPPRGLSPATVAPSEHTADNMSDAASVSAISVSTMDVSEAQAQPVLKPQLVTVEKAPLPPGKHQLPSRVAAASGSLSQSPPKTVDPAISFQPSVDSELTVEPLFSKRKSVAAAPPVPIVPPAPAANDKWAKKPAVDYSGDDWGDDPWDYA